MNEVLKQLSKTAQTASMQATAVIVTPKEQEQTPYIIKDRVHIS